MRMDGWTDGKCMDGPTDRPKDGPMDRPMVRWNDQRADPLLELWLEQLQRECLLLLIPFQYQSYKCLKCLIIKEIECKHGQHILLFRFVKDKPEIKEKER